MKNALELVAFNNVGRAEGTLALLDAAQRAMDEDGHDLAAAILEMAREIYISTYLDEFNPLATTMHG